jgi:hypothetical protein
MSNVQGVLTRIRSFRTGTAGVAAIEFALIVPVLVSFGFGAAELIRYLSIQKRVATAAESVSMMVSMSDRPIDANHFRFIVNSTRLIVAEVGKDEAAQGRAWNDILRVNVASIRFEPVGGSLAPMVRWTVGDRPCGLAPWSAPASPSGVPASFNGARGGLVAVDVTYEYRPLFGANFLPARTIQRTAFMPPRFSDFVGIEWAPGSATHRCPGY